MTASTGRRAERAAAAEAAFRAQVAEQGGDVLEPRWLGSKMPHRVRCAQGHLCTPKPNKVMQGVRICTTCPGKYAYAAESRFRALIAKQGGRVTGEYRGTSAAVKCICRNNHECNPWPGYILSGGGLCRTCARKDPVATEAAFRARIIEQGGQVIGEYINARKPVECICANGHRCQPWPTRLQQGSGMCYICAGQDPAASEATLRLLVTELGGQVVGVYVNSQTPIDCICPNWHPCAPTPNNVRRGQGMCNACAGKVWDVFYAVTNPAQGRVKFGVTSGDPRVRLADHRRAGYVEVVRALPGLPDAHALERHIRVTLRDAGIPAAQGREYFHIDALAVVLDVADGWTAI